MALGLTTPIPVITARLSISVDSIIDAAIALLFPYARWTLHFYTVLPL